MYDMFDLAIEFVLNPNHEGMVSNDPHDPGKLTKWGISEIYFPQVRDESFSRADAIVVYMSEFWNRMRCSEFNAGMDLMLFDCAVNQTGQCINLLQTAVRAKTDGVIGPKTIEAANEGGPAAIAEFAARRMVAYAENPRFKYYGLGWSRRLMDCVTYAMELSRGV